MAQQYGTQAQRIGRWKGNMLAHAMHKEVLGITGESKKMPKNKGDTALYRRVIPFGASDTDQNTVNRPEADPEDHRTTEGVTPTPDNLQYQDVSVKIEQYSCLYQYTDRVADLYEDDVPAHMVQQAGERMGLVREMLKYGALRACTNRFYANAVTGRASVNSAIRLNDLRRIARNLEANHAEKIEGVLAATPKEATVPIEAAYLVFCHTDIMHDLRGLDGFVVTAKYGTFKPLKHEKGAVEDFRFITSPELRPYEGAGATAGNLGLITNGATPAAGNVNVYPVLVVATRAWADLTMRGMNIMDVLHRRPQDIDKSDMLGQRGYIGCKFYDAPFIQNDGWMAVLEVGATAIVTET